MAKINIQEFADHLDEEIRKALEATIREHFPHQEYNARAVSKTFKKQLTKKCNSWEDIPNKYIRA